MALPPKHQRIARKTAAETAASISKIMPQETFRRMVALEQRRSERSSRPFAVLCIEAGRITPISGENRIWKLILPVLEAATRDTDLIGWHETGLVVGVVLTEIMPDDGLILDSLVSRIDAMLRKRLPEDEFQQIRFTCDLFPAEMQRIAPVSDRESESRLIFAAHGNSGRSSRSN